MMLFWFGRYTPPFSTVTRSLTGAASTLGSFLVAVVLALVFFAVAGHILFGVFDLGYSSIFWDGVAAGQGQGALVTIFDLLLNSFEITDTRLEHIPVASIYFYLIVSCSMFSTKCQNNNISTSNDCMYSLVFLIMLRSTLYFCF